MSGIVAERQEQGVALFLARGENVDQAVGTEREADGRFVQAKDAIGTAPTQRSGNAFGVNREAEPLLVFEAMALAGVEGQPSLAGKPRGQFAQGGNARG